MNLDIDKEELKRIAMQLWQGQKTLKKLFSDSTLQDIEMESHNHNQLISMCLRMSNSKQ